MIRLNAKTPSRSGAKAGKVFLHFQTAGASWRPVLDLF
jgi:hypothetical protein